MLAILRRSDRIRVIYRSRSLETFKDLYEIRSSSCISPASRLRIFRRRAILFPGAAQEL
jgi:hypothetical protein